MCNVYNVTVHLCSAFVVSFLDTSTFVPCNVYISRHLSNASATEKLSFCEICGTLYCSFTFCDRCCEGSVTANMLCQNL